MARIGVVMRPAGAPKRTVVSLDREGDDASSVLLGFGDARSLPLPVRSLSIRVEECHA
jgi:hypothetical protein